MKGDINVMASLTYCKGKKEIKLASDLNFVGIGQLPVRISVVKSSTWTYCNIKTRRW